jgi:hypothetical protein
LPGKLEPYISIIELTALYLLKLVVASKRIALTLIMKMFLRLVKLGY